MLKTLRHIGNYLTESERKIVFFLFFVIVCGSILKFFGYTPRELVSSELNQSHRLALQTAIDTDFIPHYDLNHITYDELLYIKGIGPATANSVLDYQETKGFTKVDDLLYIKGIGEKRIEDWRECFFVDGDLSAPLAQTSAADSQTVKVQSTQSSAVNTKPVSVKPANTKININTASLEQLMTLNGIGKTKAELIISYRTKHKFERIEDIKNVKGIGDKTFEKLKENINLGE